METTSAASPSSSTDYGQASLATLSAAVAALHAQYFTSSQSSYARWQVASRVQNMPPFSGTCRPLATKTTAQLAELTLFFLLWTEASSLRHTPELLCLLFFLMHNSVLFDQVVPEGSGPGNATGSASQTTIQFVPTDASDNPLSFWLPSQLQRPSPGCTITAQLMKIRKEAAARMTNITKDPNPSVQASPSRAQGGSNSDGSQQRPEPLTYCLWDTLLLGWVGRGGSDSGDPSALWPASYDEELRDDLVSRQARGAVAESPVQRQLAALDVHKRHVNCMVRPVASSHPKTCWWFMAACEQI